MKNLSSLILTLIITLTVSGQSSNPKEGSEVKWYTIQEAEKMTKESAKPLFIDAYTDWCGWCKKMDKDTFTNPVIRDILNSKFIPVKFNAEGKEEINFLGKKFINDGKAGNAHQLAVALLNGQLSYPTVVFLIFGSDGKIGTQAVPGYKEPKEMEMLLSFFADKAYEKQSWEDFQKSFKGKIQ